MLVSWPSYGHNKAMAVERKNSFHLLLSDDELKLLRLLAEREGLNASDYLRSLIRQMAGSPSHLAQVLRLGAALGGTADLAKVLAGYSETSKAKKGK
jgi:hypothetical protein